MVLKLALTTLKFMTKRLTSAQKRITIARDVIEQLLSGTINPIQGCFIGESLENLIENSENKDSLQKLFKKQSKCSVCAKGSIFVSWAMKFNKLNVLDFNNIGFDGSRLFENKEIASAFPRKLLTEIEVLFEGECAITYDWNRGVFTYFEEESLNLKHRELSKNSKYRLIEIMGMIIDNFGEYCYLN